MRWKELQENQNHGPLSNCRLNRHRNSPEGRLEDALSLWVAGGCREAEPHLIALRDEMRPYRLTYQTTLYRGMTMSPDRIEAALRDGLTVNHHGKTIESWATSEDAVYDFMNGFESWIMLHCRSRDVEVMIDLAEYNEQANPFTDMGKQHEVLVLARPEVFYPPESLRSGE